MLYYLPPLQGLHLTNVQDEAECDVQAFFADVLQAPGGPHSLERLTLRGPGVGGFTAETLCTLSSVRYLDVSASSSSPCAFVGALSCARPARLEFANLRGSQGCVGTW